jgi:hypothetical protein
LSSPDKTHRQSVPASAYSASVSEVCEPGLAMKRPMYLTAEELSMHSSRGAASLDDAYHYLSKSDSR